MTPQAWNALKGWIRTKLRLTRLSSITNISTWLENVRDAQRGFQRSRIQPSSLTSKRERPGCPGHPGQTGTISPVVHLSAGAYRCTQERWCCTEKGRTANSGSSSGCSRTLSTWLSNPARVWRPAGLHWCCSEPDTRFPGSKTSGAADRKATYPTISMFTGENWSYLGETPVNPHPPKPGWKLQKQKTSVLRGKN